MNIYQLREQIGQEIVDYNQLKDILKNYAHPRGKISEWLNKGELIRIKKGLYIFGDSIRREPFSLEIIANLIYGPSAISLSYALAYYGLIPERVHTLTSISPKRNKVFATPVGEFTYRYLNPEKYAIGIQLMTTKNGLNFLIATPEKALSDFVVCAPNNLQFKNKQQVQEFLLADMRMDEDILRKLDIKLLTEIVTQYQNPLLDNFLINFKEWLRNYE